jgi:dihydrofolate reductase
MKLAIIAAVARNGVIGQDNKLPWRLPEDLKRFRGLTSGHHIIMGRKTYESLGRLLPDRTTVIVTRNPDYHVAGALVAHSLEQAIGMCAEDEIAFLIGGEELYRSGLPIADLMFITEIDADFAGDTLFPPYDIKRWLQVARENGVSADGLRYSFVNYCATQST